MPWPPTRTDSHRPDSDDWNEIVLALSTWGGDTNANGKRLSNVGDITLAPGAVIIQSPAAANTEPITVGASPFTYTAGAYAEIVYFSGGAVSSVTRNGQSLGSSMPSSVLLRPGASVVVTYTEAPTMISDRFSNMAAEESTAPVTPGASPYTYTAGDDFHEMVYITGGVVTGVTRNGQSLGEEIPLPIFLRPGESIVITYTDAPTIVVDR